MSILLTVLLWLALAALLAAFALAVAFGIASFQERRRRNDLNQPLEYRDVSSLARRL